MIAYHRVGYRVYFGVRSGAFLEVFVDPVHPCVAQSFDLNCSLPKSKLTHSHLSLIFHMVQPSDDTSRSRHHRTAYIPGGDLFIEVQSFTLIDRTLFRVHSHFFTRDSQLFNARFNPSATPGVPREGTSQGSPFRLQNVTVGDFEKFLWVFYNPTYSLYEADIKDWIRILELANMWSFVEVKAFALRELEKKEDGLDVVQRIVLYRQNQIEERHIHRHYVSLCARDTVLTLEECRALGLETTHLISAAREKLRAAPSDGGTSPLPQGIEPEDVQRMLSTLVNRN
ncbi:uncharacterized protein LACBIDRAFT_294548 [Laccaria bicolor S238N-H82]|uniref:Predicted protein n=1 Tax=Laccaria bicolor (strain S238N-H82 / ATCC MYA-4686) TaxID=486041 RepID=B0DDM9_LACBS|nr:uncharacterized protein LACBIDRAFT_294548 [Laccaria bicolor S238N-H82]EDR07243.1 predicted protein [Laccaria bicolor S238N-H82]|eukprot:XP_001882174.1 predicted protein [Laccaria bicolor S238N-H82]